MSQSMSNQYTDRVSTGVLLSVAAVLLFSIQDGIAKYLSMLYAPIVIAWMRFVAQTAMLGAIYGPRLKRDLFRTKVPKLQFYRALCMAGANLSFLVALRYVPLGEATAIFFLAPIIVMLLSNVFLGETISRFQWLSIALSVIGVMFIVRPGADIFDLAATLPLLSAVFIALYQMLTRKVMATDHAGASNFITSLMCVAILGVFQPFFWVTLPWTVWLIIAIQAVFAMVGHLFMTHSYRFASAAVLAPFTYFQIVFSALIGLMAFGHMPDGLSALGIALVTLGGLVLVLRLRQPGELSQPQGKEPGAK
jgi:drug/metabolite transporter (DMT)-like permease